jgi:hypothetical protein
VSIKNPFFFHFSCPAISDLRFSGFINLKVRLQRYREMSIWALRNFGYQKVNLSFE